MNIILNETQLSFVIYVIKQLTLKVNQNIIILNPVYTNKNKVSLLKNKILLNQKLMK